MLFGINFAMGVATGITMEFQFGTNWAYYSHYVGDIFGAPLAIEGLMAFFLEATFVGLFFFGWDRLSKIGHLIVTWLVALGIESFGAVDPDRQCLDAEPGRRALQLRTPCAWKSIRFADVIFNPVAQAKFVHTVSAGYVIGSMFVLAISAWYLLRGRNVDFAKRSMTVAASFGLASALSVVVLGDECGYTASAEPEDEDRRDRGRCGTPSPRRQLHACSAFPTWQRTRPTAEVKIPWVLGLIATRSIDKPVPGIDELVERAQRAHRQRHSMRTTALQMLRRDPRDRRRARALRRPCQADLGYALCCCATSTIRPRPRRRRSRPPRGQPFPMCRCCSGRFRFMVGFGLVLHRAVRRGVLPGSRRASLRAATAGFCDRAVSLPLPWIAAELGWIVAEYGRQPWAIDGVLPTFLGVSATSEPAMYCSQLSGFAIFYSALAVVDVFLLVRMIRRGPDGLGYWPPAPAVATAA